MRLLVTGARGFVGRHLVPALRARGHEVLEADRTVHADNLSLDVTDALAVRAAFDLARPDAVAHLAAQASVDDGVRDPDATFRVNAGGVLNVLNAARAVAEEEGQFPRVLIASSADVYGAQPPNAYPVRETAPPLPRNAYAASKAAAEALAQAYAYSYGVDVVVTRGFNSIGPRQDERFAIAGFAAQLARIAADPGGVVLVGNLDASRDVLDVRDVCAAYVLLLEGRGEAGEIYNVCSGKATTMRELLRRLIEIARVAVEVREDPGRMRPSDVPVSVGDAAKLRAATGWEPRIPLAAALRGVYEDARAHVTSANGANLSPPQGSA